MSNNKKVVKALKISKIDINKITIGSKLVDKRVPIYYNGNSNGLVYQTPFLEVKEKLRRVNENVKLYNIDTWFKGDSNKRIAGFYQFIDNFEDHISNLVEKQVINSNNKWFNNQQNINIKSLIRLLEADNNISYIKWTLDLTNNNIFVDENKNVFNPEDLDESHVIKLIIEVGDLWIHENQFGPAAVVRKILVKKLESSSEYEFDETDSDDSDNEELISALATEQKPSNTKQNNPKQNNMYEKINKQTVVDETVFNKTKNVVGEISKAFIKENVRNNINRKQLRNDKLVPKPIRGNEDNYFIMQNNEHVNIISDDEDSIF
ncbi:hypothetical protein H012_gp626 [Acanthamoeba polyphaga moumouvirus]|uniref:Uncharacterized protein n=2 Tax=Moumouvirus TaxID=3080801 RepID=L7RC44_9VIRU|nr:hypothetical protein H012_gp626 [Acanthamoeba polyphaga moumouvirus]AEX62943.1 hypothetical protein mv_R739 [Moumouvirus Monve]AGC01837.1 hypothetical protein Moumou_00297 [Acanthamoeba polyphaga moumouvirus]AQN68193.1 hypothetical protein [Saudi moumouvirus]